MSLRLAPIRIVIGLLLAIAAVDAAALDPRMPFERYGRKLMDASTGLPQISVLAIAQTPDGYVWFGTENGLVRFDGLTPTVFDSSNTVALRSDTIGALVADRRGALWIATINGLVVYERGRFRRYSTDDGLPGNNITAMAEARDGAIWIGTADAGVIRLVDGAVDRRSAALEKMTIHSMAGDPAGPLWVGTSSAGLYRVAPDRQPEAIAGLPGVGVNALAIARDGTLWAATMAGLARLPPGAAAFIEDERPSFRGKVVKKVLTDSTGALWIAVQGVAVYRDAGGALDSFGVAQGLPDVWIRSLFEDRDGGVWIGTAMGGAVQLRDMPFTWFGSRDGLPHDITFPLLETDGKVWVGTAGGLAALEGDRVVWTGLKQPVYALAPRRRGGVWVGTTDAGLYYVEDGKVHKIPSEASPWIRTLQEGPDGVLWIGTTIGLFRFESGTFTPYTLHGVRGKHIRAMHFARDGALWLGTQDHGAVRIARGQATWYDNASGLSHNAVNALFEDVDGTIWLGTRDGLNRIRKGTIDVFTRKHGLFDTMIHSILDDGRGNLWMTTNRGFFSVRRGDLDAIAAGRMARLTSTVYGTEDGLLSRECNGASPAGMMTRDGRLWFPTIKGVAVSNPRVARRDGGRVALLESLTYDGRLLEADQIVPAGKRRLELRFTAPDFDAPSRIEFRYKLERFDAGWNDAAGRRLVSYTNLPPGTYRFIVQARSGDRAPWGPQSVREFRLAPLFYQTLWFKLLASALILGVAWWFHRIRMRLLAGKTALSLLEVSRRIELILRSTADGIVEVDLEGRVAFANDAAVRMLGWPAGWRGLLFHDFVHGGRHACERCVLLDDLPRVVTDVIDTFRRSDEGAAVPVEYSRNAIVDERLALTGVVYAFRDIAERTALERMKAELVATVSHELRTPLTSIRGSLGLLAGGKLGTMTDQGRRMIDIAVSNTERLLRLVSDILDVEHLRSGEVSMTPIRCEGGSLAANAAEIMNGLASKANVTIRVLPFDAAVNADPDRMLQTLTNLISNAVKFSPEGSTVSVGGSIDGPFARFFVSDEGRGIPPEKLDLIFERFQQVEAGDRKKNGGSGLGLTICRTIVEQHGGRIWVESEPGRGSCFSFTIPLAVDEAAA